MRPDEVKVEARGQEVSSSTEADQEAAIAGVQAAVSDPMIVNVVPSCDLSLTGAESRCEGGQPGGGPGQGRHLHCEAVAGNDGNNGKGWPLI